MMRMFRVLLLVGGAVLAACDSPDLLAPLDVVGAYDLRTTSGYDGAEPSVGELVLAPDGSVERRLIFERAEGSEEFTWFGRHRVRNGALELALWPAGTTEGELDYRRVAYSPGLVVLKYGRVDDGPDIVEVYEYRSR